MICIGKPEMMESGVIKLGDKQSESKCAIVYGQINEPLCARAHVVLTGLTVAEHFRYAEGQHVLLFIDNIFRFTQTHNFGMEGTAGFSLVKCYSEAINDLNAALEVEPSLSEAYGSRASVLRHLCRFFFIVFLVEILFINWISICLRIIKFWDH